MDLKGIGISTRNWVDLAQDMGLLESPCDCGIYPPDFTIHAVSYNIKAKHQEN